MPAFNSSLSTAMHSYLQSVNNLQAEMQSLCPSDIKAAFENNGYGDMRPHSSTFVGRNDGGKYMYKCLWPDEGYGTYYTTIFVWLEKDRIVADV